MDSSLKIMRSAQDLSDRSKIRCLSKSGREVVRSVWEARIKRRTWTNVADKQGELKKEPEGWKGCPGRLWTSNDCPTDGGKNMDYSRQTEKRERGFERGRMPVKKGRNGGRRRKGNVAQEKRGKPRRGGEGAGQAFSGGEKIRDQSWEKSPITWQGGNGERYFGGLEGKKISLVVVDGASPQEGRPV